LRTGNRPERVSDHARLHHHLRSDHLRPDIIDAEQLRDVIASLVAAHQVPGDRHEHRGERRETGVLVDRDPLECPGLPHDVPVEEHAAGSGAVGLYQTPSRTTGCPLICHSAAAAFTRDGGVCICAA
jgi:hypothetical protein